MCDAYDVELVREILRQIHRSTQITLKRFEPITSPSDFTGSDEGMEKLDAICMQLIAIGEGVKNLDRITSGSLLPSYPEIEWRRVMGMRDILSHHYFDVDAATVYTVCSEHMGAPARAIEDILQDLKANCGTSRSSDK